MALPLSPSLLEQKDLSVSLVDCMKTPGELRGAVKEVAGASPEIHQTSFSLLGLRELSVCLVDCMKAQGMDEQNSPLDCVEAAGESAASIKLGKKEEQPQERGCFVKLERTWPQINILSVCTIKPGLDNLTWCDAGSEAQMDSYKEEDGCLPPALGSRGEGEAETQETAESQLNCPGIDVEVETLEDDAGCVDAKTALRQDHTPSEALRTPQRSDAGDDVDPEADGEDAGCSDETSAPSPDNCRSNVIKTPEQSDAGTEVEPALDKEVAHVDATEPGRGGGQKRTSDHTVVHCLRCNKPQENLSVHLSRACMKKNTLEDRATELQKAKESSRRWAWSNRTWDYNRLCEILPHGPSRFAMMKELLKRGFLITNKPHESDKALDSAGDADATATPSTATSAPSSPQRTDSSNPSSSDEDEGTRDPSWKKAPPAMTSSVRMKMKEADLYDKFPEDAKLLVDFKKYLTGRMKLPNCQQEVDNVSRFLRYMQPSGDEPTLDFLTKTTETRDYLTRLQGTEMSAGSILSYLNNIARFSDYLKMRPDLEQTDLQLRSKCQSYKELLLTLRKPFTKSYSKAVCETRYNQFMEDLRSVKECQTILTVVRADFLKVFAKFTSDATVSETDKTLYRYYCEAVMVFRHFQRPGAVEAMTVSEWVNRKQVDGRVVIGISQHKTATMQLALLALTQEEEAWFQVYYERIRPGHLRNNGNMFFISSTGNTVHVTNDITRLHENYNVKPATSEDVRRAAEMESATFAESQKENVARYLTNTSAVAKQHCRMQVPEVVVATAILLDSLAGSDTHLTSPPPSMDNRPSGKDFSTFTTRFPVSTDGQPPTKKARVDAGFSDDRVFYDKWRACQYDQRGEYLLSRFNHRKPPASKVARLIKKKGWKGNHPKPEEILQMWKPAPKLPIERDEVILKSVSQQTWKGLAIKDFGGEKGLRVVATRPFSKGDIVCDYHGKVITAAEGRAMMQDKEDEAGYLFFFKAGQRDLCIDAQTFPCECHPNADTVGRRINRSREGANLQPLQCVLKVDGEDMDVVLFKALQDIKVDQELNFD